MNHETHEGHEAGNFEPISKRLIGCAVEVHRNLGPGLLESTYERCLSLELEAAGLTHEAQLLTYLKLSGIHSGLLINFNHTRLKDGLKRSVI